MILCKGDRCRDGKILHIPNNIFLWCGRTNQSVTVDLCIYETIKHLWGNNIVTLGSCCGHGNSKPSIVIHSSHNIDRVIEIIKEVDDRTYELCRWELVKYNKGESNEQH